MAKQGDVGIRKSKAGDVGLSKSQAQTAPSSGGGGGGYGGGGGGGGRRRGGGGSSGVDPKEKLQATVDNLGDIYGRKKKDLEGQTKNALNVIKDKQKANNAALLQQQTQIKKNSDWQPNQQKEQSTLMALRNRMGNAAYGSGLVDLTEGIGRVDDMADVQLINTYKNNMDDAYSNWFQANTELVGDYNSALDEADQKMSDLLNQYQAALNNVSPLAAKTATMNKAAKAGAAAAKAKTAVDAKQKAFDAAKTAKKAKSNKATKSAYKKAQKALKEAKKAYDKSGVTVGKGDEKVKVPAIDMTPSKSFSSLIANRMTNASAVDPYTKEYIRPDAALERQGGYNSRPDLNRRANAGFSSNVRTFDNYGGKDLRPSPAAKKAAAATAKKAAATAAKKPATASKKATAASKSKTPSLWNDFFSGAVGKRATAVPKPATVSSKAKTSSRRTRPGSFWYDNLKAFEAQKNRR